MLKAYYDTMFFIQNSVGVIMKGAERNGNSFLKAASKNQLHFSQVQFISIPQADRGEEGGEKELRV